jgi:hypothetical protein
VPGFFSNGSWQTVRGVLTAEARKQVPGRRPTAWESLSMAVESYNDAQWTPCGREIAGCFGPAFSGLGLATAGDSGGNEPQGSRPPMERAV